MDAGDNMVVCSSKKETKKGVNNIIINNRINNSNNNNIKNKKTRKRNRNRNRKNRLKKKYNNAFWNKDNKTDNVNIINQEQNSNNINTQINNEKKQFKSKNQLVLFEIKEEDNGKVFLDIKKTLNGNYLWINCNKLISDSYIVCSKKRNNSIIKVDNEDLTYFLIIKNLFK